jgi:hypothetical protein
MRTGRCRVNCGSRFVRCVNLGWDDVFRRGAGLDEPTWQNSCIFCDYWNDGRIGLVFDRPFVGPGQVSGGTWTVLLNHFHDDLSHDIVPKGACFQCVETRQGILACSVLRRNLSVQAFRFATT